MSIVDERPDTARRADLTDALRVARAALADAVETEDEAAARTQVKTLRAELDDLPADVTTHFGEPKTYTVPIALNLLFFHDDEFSAPFNFEQGDDGCQVLHVPAGSGAEAIATIPALALDAASMPSLPNLRDDADKALGIDLIELINLLEELQSLLPEPRHRLLGYCDTDTPHLQGHRPLLQVEAEQGTAWGEIVNVSFWIPDADLRAGRLDRVRRSFEVA
jgi:hypothetical protein